MWQRVETEDGCVWQVSAWQDYDWLVHGMTDRSAGNLALHVGDDEAAVRERRQRLSQSLGVSGCAWVVGEQVHGARCCHVTNADAGAGEGEQRTALSGVDGLFTQDSRLMLAALFADCVPLVYVVPAHRIVGIVHAGWRGTAAGIAAAAVQSMEKALDVKPAEIEAAIGPCVNSCCYTVGRDTARRFSPKFWSEGDDGRVRLDLVSANRAQLLEAGVREEAVYAADICTVCDPSFFSYRRDGQAAGRMAAVVLQL